MSGTVTVKSSVKTFFICEFGKTGLDKLKIGVFFSLQHMENVVKCGCIVNETANKHL